MRLKSIMPWLKLAIGLALIVIIARQIDRQLLERIATRWRELALFFGLGVSLLAVALAGTMLRWHLLLLLCKVPHRLSDTFRLGFIGVFFSQVLLGATGGDVVKGFYVTREAPGHKLEAIYSLFLDRLLGVTGLMLLGAAGFALNWQQVRENLLLMRLLWVLAAVFAVVGIGAALLSWEWLWRHPRLAPLVRFLPGRKYFSTLASVTWALKRRPDILALCLLLSVLTHAGAVSVHVLLARGMEGVWPDLGTFFFLIPVGMLANALPLSPGGLGIGEFAYRELFLASGLRHGAELALLMRLCVLACSSAGFYYYLRGRKELKHILRQAEE